MTTNRLPFQDHSKTILGAAFVASLLVHLLFFSSFPLQLMSAPSTVNEPLSERMIRVKRIPPKEQGKLVDIQDEKSVTDQSVDTDYLSDRNRKVEKQTRSLNITRQENQSANNQQSTGEIQKKSKYNLEISDRKLQAITEKGGPNKMFHSMTSNYLPEITIGNETLLNTKEFAFNAFYIRMKREIENFWHPDRSLMQNQALHGTYITSITVILDDQGELLDTYIYKSSGIPSLDMEAVRAIEQASPYPNPPKELLMDDKKIRVNWNFIFDRSRLM